MPDIFEELKTMMPTSYRLHEENRRVLAQEVVGTVFFPYPFYVEKAAGARVTDVDGNEYIDLTGGYGPLLLGHNPDVVVSAVKETTELALHLGLPHPSQGELARLLVDASPCAEKAVFCNSGTEATMYALRAARAVTGRKKLGLFGGSYHGAHDTVLIDIDPHSDRTQPRPASRGTGIPQETIGHVLMLPYRSEAAFNLVRDHRDELAMVMIEPIQSSNPRLDLKDFLHTLRRVCTECDVPLVFDEVITGFRLGYGGGQEYFDVTPDLATYGKILGGGIPIGAVAGPAAFMDVFNFRGETDSIFAGGTFSGNPLAMRVGTAVLRHLKAHPELYATLSEQSERLAGTLNDFIQQHDFPARLMHGGSIFYLMFEKPDGTDGRDSVLATGSIDDRFYAHLHKNGVVVPGLHVFFLSMAHSVHDVDAVIEAFKQSFLELRADGML